MFKVHNSSDYRREAAACGAFADFARSTGDRELLRGMRRSRLALAENQERLEQSPPLPPVNSGALRIARRQQLTGAIVEALQLYAIWSVVSIGAAGALLAWWLM